MTSKLGTPSSMSDFDPRTEPFRLLGVDPATSDAEIDLAYGRRQPTLQEATLADAYLSIKDPARRLQAELGYPIDCPSGLLEIYYSGPTSLEEILAIADLFPAVTKTNFLAHSAARLSDPEKLLPSLVDGHAAIDAVDLYQTLKRLRHEAGRPGPSLIDVRTALNELLATHCKIFIARIGSLPVLISTLLGVKRSIEISRDRSRHEIFLGLIKAAQATIVDGLARAESQIAMACEAVRDQPQDSDRIRRLAEEWGASALLLESAGPLGFATDDEVVAWEQLRNLLNYLIDGQHIESAKKIIDAVVCALGPIAIQHPRTHALAVQMQERIGRLLGESHSIRTDGSQNPRSPHRLRRYWSILTLTFLALTIALVSSAIRFWHSENTPSAGTVVITQSPSAKAEPESLPPVASGQRYPREYVRYCHFQQERLRTVKQHVRSQEDVRTYNALASDWNSRCADFFYQDEDLRVVKEELASRQRMLEAEGERILSTWPWRSSIRPNK
jgi:hypothetical protein